MINWFVRPKLASWERRGGALILTLKDGRSYRSYDGGHWYSEVDGTEVYCIGRLDAQLDDMRRFVMFQEWDAEAAAKKAASK